MPPELDRSNHSAASTRREFLRRSGMVATALGSVSITSADVLKPTVSARSAARVLGANDRINVGIIGVGIRGFYHLREFLKQSEESRDIQVVAVSDLYSKRKDRARTVARLTEKDVHHDYRDLLARNDVDGVVIATPDHQHAQMAVDAMTAGKDVFLQKPMTYTIDEARQVAETAREHHRVVQIGSQHLSDPRHHKAKELIERGEIGELLWGQATASRNSLYGEWNDRIEPEGTPETIDWNRWLGSAPQRPFSAERYFRWRKYWDYSGGIATDLFYHVLGPFVFAMGAGFPTRVTGSGGIYVQKDRDVPDTYASLIEYPNFYINLSGSMANAAPNRYMPTAIYGHKGTITLEENRVVVMPEHPEYRGTPAARAPVDKSEAKIYDVPPVADVDRAHTDNFFACMRSRRQPYLNPDLGYRIMVAIRLGVDSYREGKVKFFDAVSEEVVDRPAPRPSYEGTGRNV